MSVTDADLDAAAVSLIETLEELESRAWPWSWVIMMVQRRHRKES